MQHDEEAGTGASEAELAWYFGFYQDGSTPGATAAGDVGLKSPLGAQLDAVREERIDGQRIVDSGRADEQMARAATKAIEIGNVEQALGGLTDAERLVLRYTFGSKPVRTGVSRVVLLTKHARAEAEKHVAERDHGRKASEADVEQLVLESKVTGVKWLEMAKAAASVLSHKAIVAYHEQRTALARRRTRVRWDNRRSAA